MPLHLRLAREPDCDAIGRILKRAFTGSAISAGLFPPRLRVYRSDDPEHAGPAVDEEVAWRISRARLRLRTPGHVTLVVEDDGLQEGLDEELDAEPLGGAGMRSGTESEAEDGRPKGMMRRVVGVAQWSLPEVGIDGVKREEEEVAREVREEMEAMKGIQHQEQSGQEAKGAEKELEDFKSLDKEAFNGLISDIVSGNERIYGKDNIKRNWRTFSFLPFSIPWAEPAAMLVRIFPAQKRKEPGELTLDLGSEPAPPDLLIIAVDPAHQKRGAGSMLLDWGIERAKMDRTDIILEASPPGLALYQSRGFETIEEVYLFGGLHHRMVWRGRSVRAPYGRLPVA